MKIVSFSGIDGAGKSTQIAAFQAWLHAAGLRTELRTFWDDVVVLSRFREVASHKAFGGDKGIGTPEQPINRRDKNVSSWTVTAARYFLYTLDAISLRLQIGRLRHRDIDIVIFDRYIYDELANLPLSNRFTRVFTRLILRFTPRPTAAYLLDADPELARARKPEYPLDFLERNRQAYLTLSRLEGCIIVASRTTIEATEVKIRSAFIERSLPKLVELPASSTSLP